MRAQLAVVLVTSCGFVVGSGGCGGGGDDAPSPPPPIGGEPADARTPGGEAGTPDAPIDAPVVGAGADLSIAMAASPAPVDLSSTLTYTIDIENHGELDATNVVVTQRLPAGDVAFLSAAGIDWTCSHDGQDVTCKRPLLHVGTAPSIAVKVTTPPASGSLTTSATVAGDQDRVLTNNDAIVATMVLAPDLATADLSVVMSDAPDPVQGIPPMGCGSMAMPACTTYTITVANAGPDVATELVVALALPGQGLFIEGVGDGWVCLAPSGGTLTCTRPTLGIATAPVITLTWKAPSPGGFDIKVDATVHGSSTDRNPSNDRAVETTTVKP